MSGDKDGKHPRIVIVTGTGAAGLRMLAGDGQAPMADKIERAPLLRGPHGRAWLCDQAALRASVNCPEDQDGSLAIWIIEAPEYHPAWHSYSLVLVHLRPLPGPWQTIRLPNDRIVKVARRTLIYLEGATHELVLHALDPKGDRNAMLTDARAIARLSPANFGAQIAEGSDRDAFNRVQRAVEMICNGQLSPDTDFIGQWADLFGDNMMKDRPNYKPPRVRND